MHKTDVGAVKLDLRTSAEVAEPTRSWSMPSART